MLPYIPFEWAVCTVIRMNNSTESIVRIVLIVIFSVALTNEDIFQGSLERKKK